MGISFEVQAGWGAFGADGSIPTLVDPTGAVGDPEVWTANYILANGEPARLKSAVFQAMRQDGFNQPGTGIQSGIVYVPYFVAVGPQQQDPQMMGTTPIPPALFQTTFYPQMVNYVVWVTNGFRLMEAGVMDSTMGKFERTWSEHEVVARDGELIVVACGSPVGGAPSFGSQSQTLPNTLLWLDVQGYNDVPVYKLKESSLARYAR